MRNCILYFVVLAFIITSCSDKKNAEYLPKAAGNAGDILLVMDSVQWRGELGKEIRKIFQADIPASPQPEPMFNVIWIHPHNDVSMLTRMRNLVYVFTLDQNTAGSRTLRKQFSEETLNKIKTDTSYFLSTNKDEYAKGQDVMYLFGDSEKNLIHHLQVQKQNITDFFNRIERQRLTTNIYKTKSTTGITEQLKKEKKFEIHLPAGYILVDNQNDFAWLRYITADMDKDIFISWKPYESEYQLLPDSIVTWRNEICKKYLYEDPENPQSYLVTEQTHADVFARQVQFNNHFAMEVRGLWHTYHRSMGGPFVGYALVDQPRGLLYYIEGFAYAPSKDKREIIRELEAILWTFKTSADITKQ